MTDFEHEFQSVGGLPVVTGPAWPGARYFYTTRAGVVADACLPGKPLWLRQVHGADVADADTLELEPSADGSAPAADASVTATPGRVLAVVTADCLPVIMMDADATVLGVAHAGWRGLAAGVLENTLRAMRAKAPGAGGWRAWVGPGIGPRAFEVGEDVVRAFSASDPQALALFAPRADTPAGSPPKWMADLPGLARLRLRRAGVTQTSLSGLCTFSDPGRFFSYRRDRDTGRMALLAWLSPSSCQA